MFGAVVVVQGGVRLVVEGRPAVGQAAVAVGPAGVRRRGGALRALVLTQRAVGDQVVGRFALVAPLGLRPHGALGRDVVGELTAVVAPDLAESLLGHGPSVRSLAVFALGSRHGRGLDALVRGLALELHLLFVAQAPEAGHLDHRLVDEDVGAAVVRGDEAPSLGHVEPLALALAPDVLRVAAAAAAAAARALLLRPAPPAVTPPFEVGRVEELA